MTRERLPPGTVLQRAYGVLDKFKISRTFFVKTDQEGCAIAASDINAANGITPASTVPQAIGEEQKSVKSGHLRTTENVAERPEEVKDEPQPEEIKEPEQPKVETVPEHILNNVDEKEPEKEEESQDDLIVSS